MPEEFDFFWDYEPFASSDAIWDRGWMSELAYQQTLRRKLRLDPEHRVVLQQMLKLYGVVNVVVVCDSKLLTERLKVSHDDKFDDATVLDVNDWFKKHSVYYGTDVLISCDARKPYPNCVDLNKILKIHERRVNTFRHVIGEELCLTKRASFRMERSASAVPTSGHPAG